MTIIDNYMIDKGYEVRYEKNEYYKGEDWWGYVKERAEAEEKSIKIKGLVVSGDFNGTIGIDSSDIGIGIYDGSLWSRSEKIENASMCIDGRNGSGIYACVEWTKVE